MIKKIIASVLVLLVIGFAVFKIFFEKPDLNSTANNINKNLNSYYLEANMDVMNGEDKREFFVSVTYKKANEKDLFKVSLLDKGLNQEQLILKNETGVYVLTPALNKVYQFQGDWPMSSPKPYIYQSLLDVFKGEYTKTAVDGGAIITSYPKFDNKSQWHKQEVKFDKELQPIYLKIYDKNNNNVVKVDFIKIEFDIQLADNTFDVNANLQSSREITSSVTVHETDLPLLPVNSLLSATLKEQSTAVIGGYTVYILSYEGAKSFTIVQRLLHDNETATTESVSGRLIDLMNGFGIYSQGILSYVYNGLEYSIYSDTLTLDEMIELANGMEVSAEK